MHISDRLGRLALFYHREAAKCERGRAYLAACVIKGAALEALLKGMCFLYPSDLSIPKKEVSNEEKQGSRVQVLRTNQHRR